MNEVPPIAKVQGGVFTAAQAVAADWTPRQVRRRLATGRWVYVAGIGLARAPDGPVWSAFQLAQAARLTVPDAVISHGTAGLLHGFPLDENTGPAHLISQMRHHSNRNLRVHRLRLAPEEVVRQASWLAVTSPQRTVLDLLSSDPLPQALDLWAWASSHALMDVATLRAAVAARRSWHGARALAVLLSVVQDGAVSGAEHLLHSLLKQAGIAGWVAGVPVRDGAGLIGVVDLLFPEAKLVIEVDGFRAHSSREQFVRDRRRQNRLVAAGYTVLRFTWSDLTDQPARVIAQIQAAIERAS